MQNHIRRTLRALQVTPYICNTRVDGGAVPAAPATMDYLNNLGLGRWHFFAAGRAGGISWLRCQQAGRDVLLLFGRIALQTLTPTLLSMSCGGRGPEEDIAVLFA